MTRTTSEVYNFFKVAEGGFGQRLALTLLRGEGFTVEPAPSAYVGMTAVKVYGNKRIRRRAERILFSY